LRSRDAIEHIATADIVAAVIADTAVAVAEMRMHGIHYLFVLYWHHFCPFVGSKLGVGLRSFF
jgi:hypothetical protein